MLQDGAEEYPSTAPWIAIFPGLAIALTVFDFSLSATPCATPSTPNFAIADADSDQIEPRCSDCPSERSKENLGPPE